MYSRLQSHQQHPVALEAVLTVRSMLLLKRKSRHLRLFKIVVTNAHVTK